MMQRVFVYGTFMRDAPNHGLLKSNDGVARFYGEGVTIEKWPLVVGTSSFIPMLLDARGYGQRVKGDIFEVDDNILKIMDQLEKHPRIYERTWIDIQTACCDAGEHDTADAAGTTITCWTYLFRKFKPELLSLPFMDRYAGDIMFKYVPGHQRTINPFAEVMPNNS